MKLELPYIIVEWASETPLFEADGVQLRRWRVVNGRDPACRNHRFYGPSLWESWKGLPLVSVQTLPFMELVSILSLQKLIPGSMAFPRAGAQELSGDLQPETQGTLYSGHWEGKGFDAPFLVRYS